MLIIYPECKKEVSDQSQQCIYCGYPVSDMGKQELDSNRKYNLDIYNRCGVDTNTVLEYLTELNNGDASDHRLTGSFLDEVSPNRTYAVLMREYPEKVAAWCEFLKSKGIDARITECKIIKQTKPKGRPNNRCPQCGNEDTIVDKRGFSIVTGFIGSSRYVNHCPKCGRKWKVK